MRGARRFSNARATPHRAASCTDELLRRALHDSVTALPGRELFIDEVRRSLATGGRAAATQVVIPRGATATARPARIPDGVRLPLLEHDHPLALIASIGVATASCGRDADQLVRMGEIAMVAAREAGGDCHRPFATSPGSV